MQSYVMLSSIQILQSFMNTTTASVGVGGWGGGGGRAGGGRSDFCLHGTHCEGRGLFYTGGVGGGGVSFIALLHCCRGHWAKTLGRRGYCYSPQQHVAVCCKSMLPLSSSAPLPPAPNERVRHPGGGGGGGGRGGGSGPAPQTCKPSPSLSVCPWQQRSSELGSPQRHWQSTAGKRPTQFTVPSSPVYYL